MVLASEALKKKMGGKHRRFVTVYLMWSETAVCYFNLQILKLILKSAQKCAILTFKIQKFCSETPPPLCPLNSPPLALLGTPLITNRKFYLFSGLEGPPMVLFSYSGYWDKKNWGLTPTVHTLFLFCQLLAPMLMTLTDLWKSSQLLLVEDRRESSPLLRFELPPA